jgi:hypothetical protein
MFDSNSLRGAGRGLQGGAKKKALTPLPAEPCGCAPRRQRVALHAAVVVLRDHRDAAHEHADEERGRVVAEPGVVEPRVLAEVVPDLIAPAQRDARNDYDSSA